jgi:hypothetical protein
VLQLPQNDGWRTQETMALIHAVLKFDTAFAASIQTPTAVLHLHIPPLFKIFFSSTQQF